MLSDSAIRASWEAERDSMRWFLLTEKKFNPNAVEKCINNFIKSMVFAKLPCCSKPGIKAAFMRYAGERASDKVSKAQFLKGYR